MRPLDHASPRSLEEAIAELAPGTDTAAALAGGTDLVPLLESGLLRPLRLISLRAVPELSDAITQNGAGITIGARATLADLAAQPLPGWCGALVRAVQLAATAQLRNVATLGGNLLQRPRCWYYRTPEVSCWRKGGAACPARDGENRLHAIFDRSPCVAVHPSDPAAALLALDASVRLRGPAGERTLPLAGFYALPDDGHRSETVLQPGEIVLAVRVPAPAGDTCSTYLKAMDRGAWSFALAGAAVSLSHTDGRLVRPRIVLSGVAPIPWRLRATESMLEGAGPDTALFERAAAAGLAEARPLAHNGWKLPLARALIVRALEACAQSAATAP